jgi:hypothetical protein
VAMQPFICLHFPIVKYRLVEKRQFGRPSNRWKDDTFIVKK